MIRLFIKSSVAGTIASISDITLLFVFEHFLSCHYMLSVNVAFICAVFINFSIQKYWTFEKKDSSIIHVQFFKFISVSGLNLVLNAGLMYVLVNSGIWYIFSQIIVTILLAGMNFAFYKFFIFNEESSLPKHLVGFLAAIIIGLTSVAPQVFFINQVGDQYKGVYMYRSDAELHYLASMKYGPSNPFILEKDYTPAPLYTFSERLLGLPAKILHISIPDINLLYKFLFPFFIAFLAYLLVFRLIQNRLYSVAASFLILLGPSLLSFPDLIHFIKWEQVYGQFMLYSRPVNPQFSSILFFIYLHTLLSAIRKKSWEYFILLGLLFGLSFYVYLYSAIFFLALNIVFLRDKKMFVSVLIGFGIGVAALSNLWQVVHHPYYADFAKISHIASSHMSIISIVGAITLVLFLLRFENKLFLSGLLATTFIVVNQQIVTGKLLQEGHFHWYFNTPIFSIIIIVALFNIFKNHNKTSVAIALAICFLSFTDAVLIQSSTYNNSFKESLYQNKYSVVFDWLNKNTKKDSVILANNTLSALVPVYTNNKVVWEGHAEYYLMSPERRKITIEYALNNIKEKNMDYVVWDKEREPNWNMTDKVLKEVYRDGTLVIYAYKS